MELQGILGRNLQHARTKLGLSQTEVSTKLGLASHSAISEMESGQRQVSAQELVNLAKILGKNLDWFFKPDAITDEFLALARTKEKDLSREVLIEAEKYFENYLLLRRLLKSQP